MHSGIVLAVVADDPVEAVALVEQFNETNAHWSDWNDHGGRWMDEIPNGVLRYTDNPTLFMQTVEKFMGYTQKTVKGYLDDLHNKTIGELVTDPKYRFPNGMGNKVDDETEEEKHERLHNSLAVWRAQRLLEVVAGAFTSDQHFNDCEYGIAHDGELKKRILENPEKQFIVMWDYHH